MPTFLALGFLIGLRHALEADHVAAVVSLATRGGTVRDHARQGALWGLGHTVTLVLLAGGCVLLGVALPESAERWFEAAVGAMLVLLGASVLVSMRSQGVHLHGHRHADGRVHFHAHRHAAGLEHADDSHEHAHRRPPLRALAVGAVHGLAGSAAMVLMTASAARSPLEGLLYIAVFGLGSIAGMVSLAIVLAMPLRLSARRYAGLYRALCTLVGALSVGLGGKMVWDFAAWIDRPIT